MKEVRGDIKNESMDYDQVTLKAGFRLNDQRLLLWKRLDMSDDSDHVTSKELRTPRAAAIAGIIFAILFATSYFLILQHAPGKSGDIQTWLALNSKSLSMGISLLPYAGIAFLWFMAVVRDGIGHLEDQFFSTLLIGSGLLYLCMTLMSAALASGALTVYAQHPDLATKSGFLDVVRSISNESMTIYAVRMAGMFLFVLGSIWTRTGLMPPWLVVLTFASALVLLVSISLNRWMVMVFPSWVLLVSVFILVRNYRNEHSPPEQLPGR